MDKSIIFLDLDGTILDASGRSYLAYKDILKKNGKDFLSQKKYLKMKRENAPIKEILKKTKSESLLPVYEYEFGKKIESSGYLSSDRLFAGAKKTLIYLKKDHRLFLVTARKKRNSLIKQLKRLGIYDFFSKVFSTGSKFETIMKNKKQNSVLVADSEKDLLAGKINGIKTIAATSGMRSKKFLRKYRPDFFISDITQLKKIL